MSTFTFQKAVKYGSKLRMAIIGTSGSGKTYSSLRIATTLGKKIAYIDTEHGSARKYSDEFNFDVIELDSYSVENFLACIYAAEKNGYDVLIIDSLSHAWSGKDGILEFVDSETAKSKSKNQYTSGWREATPLHNKLVDTILASKLHIICCMRSKSEYVMQEDEKGKKFPRKIGMQPVQREGMEYEFDIIGDIDTDHKMLITKSRCSAIDNKLFNKPGEEFAQIVLEWLGGDVPPAKSDPVPQATTPQTPASPTQSAVPGSNLSDTLSSTLKYMYTNNISGYGDVKKLNESVLAVLGVPKVSQCTDIQAMQVLLDRCRVLIESDTPFEEKSLHLNWGDTKSNQEDAPAPISEEPQPTTDPASDLVFLECMELCRELDAEINKREVSDSVANATAKNGLHFAELKQPGSITSLIKAIQGYKLKPAPVSDEVLNLRQEIHRLIKFLIAGEIDSFEVSNRLTNSLNEWLGTKTIDSCTDVDKLAAYALHLESIKSAAIQQSNTQSEMRKGA